MKKIRRNLDFISKYVLFFMLYAILGWFYEVACSYAAGHGLVNRGSTFGPWVQIYGWGMTLILFLFEKWKSKDKKIKFELFFVFIGIALLATIIELLTSYLMEAFTGKWLWDYTKYKIQFQGRIALNTTIRFGIGGSACIYLFYPLFKKINDKLGKKGTFIVSSILALLFILDIIICTFIHYEGPIK